MFDRAKLLNTPNLDEVVEYIESFDGPITINTNDEAYTGYKGHIRMHGLPKQITLALVKKRYICDNRDILWEIAVNNYDDGLVLEAINIYHENGWLMDVRGKTIIHDIMTRHSQYPHHILTNKLFDRIIEIYDELKLPINITDGWRTRGVCTLSGVAQYGHKTILVKLFKVYLERHLPIPDNLLYTYVRNNISNDKYDDTFKEFLKLCQENSVNIYENCEYTLSAIVAGSRDWDIIKEIIDLYMKRGLSLATSHAVLISIGKHHDIPAIDFIIDYYEKNKISLESKYEENFYVRPMSFADAVIGYNNVAALKHIIKRNVPITNKITRMYIPCPDCYNGEPHSCNFRYITTNYICMTRYNVPIEEINTIEEDKPEIYIRYRELSTVANEDEVYNIPGCGEIDTDTDSDSDDQDVDYEYDWYKQAEYETPPQILSYKKLRDSQQYRMEYEIYL